MTPSISATIYKKKIPSPTRPQYRQLKVPLHHQVPKLQLPAATRIYAKLPSGVAHTFRVQDVKDSPHRYYEMTP